MVASVCVGLALAMAGLRCSSQAPSGDSCNPDENGVTGSGTTVIVLNVSDTAFTVGAIDGGPGEPNIVAENVADVKVTLTNVGTKPHDFVVRCLPTPNSDGCPTQSCFPPGASIPPLKPGASATIEFVTPIHEGRYIFVSDVPGDSQPTADGGATGLAGAFVLM